MSMDQPVEVDAEHWWLQVLDKVLGIKVTIIQHPYGQVNNAHAVTGPFQGVGNAGKAHGVHLENMGGGYPVTYRPV